MCRPPGDIVADPEITPAEQEAIDVFDANLDPLNAGDRIAFRWLTGSVLETSVTAQAVELDVRQLARQSLITFSLDRRLNAAGEVSVAPYGTDGSLLFDAVTPFENADPRLDGSIGTRLDPSVFGLPTATGTEAAREAAVASCVAGLADRTGTSGQKSALCRACVSATFDGRDMIDGDRIIGCVETGTSGTGFGVPGPQCAETLGADLIANEGGTSGSAGATDDPDPTTFGCPACSAVRALLRDPVHHRRGRARTGRCRPGHERRTLRLHSGPRSRPSGDTRPQASVSLDLRRLALTEEGQDLFDAAFATTHAEPPAPIPIGPSLPRLVSALGVSFLVLRRRA